MKNRIVYLDHAATSYPKPRSVTEAMRAAIQTETSPGRGSHSLSRKASETIYSCRETAGRLFGCDPERVILTFNATHGINIAVRGEATPYSHILISDIEHNSVLRTVDSLTVGGVTYDTFGSFGGDKRLILDDIERKIRPNTRILIMNHVSNITGVKMPAAEVGELCARRGICYILDASQSAGREDIDIIRIKADYIAMAGHKGLLGPQGTGLLLLGENVRGDIMPLITGGSGSDSLSPQMPEHFPDRLEAGTQASFLAAGLEAGMREVMKRGVENVRIRENHLGSVMRRELSGNDRVVLYNGNKTGPIALFNIKGISPSKTAEYLDGLGICVRAGLHCAPLAHYTVGTGEDGAVRASVGFSSEYSDVIKLSRALEKL